MKFKDYYYFWDMGKKVTVESIPYDAKIQIEVPGSFYARLQQLTIHYAGTRPHEEMMQAMQALSKNENPKNEFEYHIHTLTILMWELEKKAKEQGKIKPEEIEIPDNMPTPPSGN